MMKVTVNVNEENNKVKAGQVRFCEDPRRDREDLRRDYVLVITDGYGKYNAVKLTEDEFGIVTVFETLYDAYQDSEVIRHDFPYVADAELIINE